MKKAYNDDFRIDFQSDSKVEGAQEKFLAYIQELEKETHWLDINIQDIQSKAIDMGPLFSNKLLEDYNVYGNSLEAVNDTITDGSVMGYAKGSQFMITNKEDKQSYLLSQAGYLSLVQIAGSSCPAFGRRTLKRQEEELNYDLIKNPEKVVKAQICMDKIQTVHSSRYKVLFKDRMLKGIIDVFDNELPLYDFRGGSYSHAGIYAEWSFPEQQEDIVELYDEGIVDLSDAIPMVKLYTSDIGESAATLSAYLEIPGKTEMKIGTPTKVYHRGEVTENDVVTAAGDIFSKFKDLVKLLANTQKVRSIT